MPREPQPPNVNRSVEESLTGLEAVLGPAPGRACAARRSSRLRSAAPTRGRSAPAGLRHRESPRRGRRAGDRLRGHDRHGEPGAGARVLPGRPGSLGRGVELTAHFHNTPRAGLANVLAAMEAGSTRSSRASGSWAAARCHRGRPATSPPRTSSRCSTRWGSRPASTSMRCWPPRARSRLLGRPLGSHTLVAGPVDWHRWAHQDQLARRCSPPCSSPTAARSRAG